MTANRKRLVGSWRARREWRHYRWAIAILSSLCLMVTFGTVYSLSVFNTALEATFGASPSDLSLLFSGSVFTLYAVAMGAGFLADRYRPRALMAAATVCWCVGLFGAAASRTYLELVLLYGLLGAIGCGICYVTVYATVARWFDERLGLAMGILSMGFGLGIFAFPPASQELITRFSWRTAYLVFAAVSAVVLLATTVVLRDRPSDWGGLERADGGDGSTADGLGTARGDGTAGRTDEPAATDRETPDDDFEADPDEDLLSVSESLTSGAFWLLAIGYMLGFYAFYTVLAHLVPYTTDLGVSATAASTAVGLIGGASVVTRLGGAYLSDHVGRIPILVTSLAVLSACSFAVLASASSTAAVFLVAALFGLGYGSTASLYSPLIADMFGMTSVGRMLGLTSMSFGIAGLTGPYITSVLFTATGTYVVPFAVAGVTPLVGIACIVASVRLIDTDAIT